MTRRRPAVLGAALLTAVLVATPDSRSARAAEPSWSASPANRCTVRTLLLGAHGQALPLPDQIRRLAALTSQVAGEDRPSSSPIEAADLLGIGAARQDGTETRLALNESGASDPRARQAMAGFLAEAAIDLGRVAPKGSLSDAVLGGLATVLARTGRIDLALAALDRIPDPDARRQPTHTIAQLLQAAGSAADAQRFYDRIPDAATDPFTEGLVPNLLALGRAEDALAVAIAGDVRLAGQHEIPIAEHHLLTGDAAAARRVYGLLRDSLQQPGASVAAQAFGGLAAGLALLGDDAEAERIRTIASARQDRTRLAADELAVTIRIAVAAQARGAADLARRALAAAQRTLAAGASLEDGSAELSALVELTGLLDGTPAAARLVETAAPRQRDRLAVLWARDGDLARALDALPTTPDYDAWSIILAAARARLAADDMAGAVALLERLDSFERTPVVATLTLEFARAGRADRIAPLIERLPDVMQRGAAYRGAVLTALRGGDRAAAERLLAALPPDLVAPVADELLQAGRRVPADLRLSLLDRLLEAAKTDMNLMDAVPGLLIDRARLLAARGDRDDAALELSFAGDLIGLVDEPAVKLERLFGLLAARADLGRDLGTVVADVRGLIDTAPVSAFERGFLLGADKVGDRAVVLRRRLRLAESLAVAADPAGARALIAPVRAFHDGEASPDDRIYLGPSLARALILAGPPEDALAFRFETQLGSQLEPAVGLITDGLARANPVLIEAALDHVSVRLAAMDPILAERTPLDILSWLYGGLGGDPAFDGLCDLPRDRDIADLATAGAVAATNATLEACLAQPTPACVTALALPAATQDDRDRRVWVLAESLTRLLDRDRRPVVLAAMDLLADGLDAKGRRLPPPAPASPRFDPRPDLIRNEPVLGVLPEDTAEPIALDEARFQLVRLWSLLGETGRALDIVPRIVAPAVRLQAILKVAVAQHRAGDVEAADDLLWLAREIAGAAPSSLWARIAVARAEIGDLAGAIRLAQQSARQGGGLFDPQKMITPVLDIASARLRAGDGTAVLARLESIPEGPSRDLAFARLAIRAAGLRQDAVVAAAAARVGNPNWRRQSLMASAEAQLRDGRVAAAAQSATDAGDAALGARVVALRQALDAAAGKREALAALDGIADPELRFEARARLALALANLPRGADPGLAARAALEAAGPLPAAGDRARLMAQLAEHLAPRDRTTAQALFAAALRATIALEATDPATLWNARIEPVADLLAAAAALTR